MQAALAADLYSSHGRFMSQSLKWWTAELVLQLHQYVACNCSLHLRTASTRWCFSETASLKASEEQSV